MGSRDVYPLLADEAQEAPQPTRHARPFGPARIMRSDEFACWQKARELAAADEIEAHRLRELNLDAIETSRQAGYDAGYQQGLADAKSEYAAKIARDAAQSAFSWRQLVPAIGTAVMDCLQQIMGELGQRDQIDGRIRTLLHQAYPQGTLTVRTHPLSIDTTQTILDAMCASFPDIRLFRVIGDKDLLPADLIIETATGIIDARLSTQLAAIEHGIIAALASTNAVADNTESPAAQ
jgi:type III secretion protein L